MAGEKAAKPAASDPGRAAHYLTFGDRLFRAGNLKKAEERYLQARSAAPDLAAPQLRLAQIALARGHYTEAANRLREAETAQPGWLVTAPDIQAIYGEPAEFLRQLARLESYVQSHPDDRDAWLVLGAQWFLSGRTAAGRRRLPAAQRSQPQARRRPGRVPRRQQSGRASDAEKSASRRRPIDARRERSTSVRLRTHARDRSLLRRRLPDRLALSSRSRRDRRRGSSYLLGMVDRAVVGYEPFFDVKLVVFPEFAHAAPIYETVEELRDRLAVPIPNEHTDRYVAEGAGAGRLHPDRDVPRGRSAGGRASVFNTTCLIGPDGLLSRYRKVNPWLPWEVHASPHDLPGYDEPLFPVVETEIGRLGAAICYDWLFPEAIRALALGGAEVLIRVSAYMDPWGATPPMDWWTLFNRARAVENFAFVVAANQGASAANYPPFSWPGGSMIVDFDGRILAQADPGPARRSSSARSTWRPCGPSGGGGAAIICFPTSGPKPILTSTPGPSIAPADARREPARSCRSSTAAASIPSSSRRPSRRASSSDSIHHLEEHDDASANRSAPRRRLDHGDRPAGRLGLPVDEPEPDPTAPAAQLPAEPAEPAPDPLKNEIPPGRARQPVMAAHFEGLGHMEQYEYAQGRRGVPRGPRAGPGLDSRLDQPGDRAAERHAASRPRRPRRPAARAAPDNFDEALELLGRGPRRDPDNPPRPFLPGHHPRAAGRAWPRPTGTSSA